MAAAAPMDAAPARAAGAATSGSRAGSSSMVACRVRGERAALPMGTPNMGAGASITEIFVRELPARPAAAAAASSSCMCLRIVAERLIPLMPCGPADEPSSGANSYVYKVLERLFEAKSETYQISAKDEVFQDRILLGQLWSSRKLCCAGACAPLPGPWRALRRRL